MNALLKSGIAISKKNGLDELSRAGTLKLGQAFHLPQSTVALGGRRPLQGS